MLVMVPAHMLAFKVNCRICGCLPLKEVIFTNNDNVVYESGYNSKVIITHIWCVMDTYYTIFIYLLKYNYNFNLKIKIKFNK